MKIGTFARKFNLNISTVRYYINKGLLTPNKIGTQYAFDEECTFDMEKIIEFKRYNFTLEEIQLLFFLTKASKFKDAVVNEAVKNILEKKKEVLISERNELGQSIEDIEKMIVNFPIITEEGPSYSGVPFSMIPNFYCPKCNVLLKLESASLSNGSIQEGILSCDCGYKAVISEGIIHCEDFDEESPFKAFENIESILSMKDQFSSFYRKLMSKTYMWMYSKVLECLNEPKNIMAGPFTYNFLLEYIEKLGKTHTYLIFDPSLKRIEKLKGYLSSWGYNIVYIVGHPKQFPIKKNIIDIYVDDYSTSNSLFTYNSFSIEAVAPLIKNSGEIVGVFTSYINATKSLHNFKKSHPNFLPEKMTLSGLKYYWSMENVNVVDEKNMGATPPNEVHFPQNILGESIQIYGYYGKKELPKRIKG